MQRGKRTRVDPIKMRKDATRLFRTCKTTEEFVAALEKAGYLLTRGKDKKLLLVDCVGDTHGLMRRIEGKNLADLCRKFPGIGKMPLPSHADLVKERKKTKPELIAEIPAFIDPLRVKKDVENAYHHSNTGAEFFAKLNRKEYSLGRGLSGFAVIDKNGKDYSIDTLLGRKAAKGLREKFPDLAAIRPRPVFEIIRRIKARNRKNAGKFVSRGRSRAFTPKPNTQRLSAFLPSNTAVKGLFVRAAQMATEKQTTTPFKPMPSKKGWPKKAVIDWKTWGHKDPARFFKLWPECAPNGFVFSDTPRRDPG